MNWICAVIIQMILTASVFEQERGILQVLEDQVDAFNNADIERLVNNVSEDFKWYYLTSDTVLLEVEGKEDFRESMLNYFKSVKKVTSAIDSYTVDDNRVSFKETVSYKNKLGEPVSSSAMGIYEIKEGLITRAWYFMD